MLRLLILFFPAILFAQQIPTSAFSLQTTRGLSTAEQSFDNNPGTSFFQGWSLQSGEFVLSFDGQYEINKIRWLDGSGQPKLILYADNSTTPLTTIFLHQYLVWGEEKVNVKVNSIRFVLDGLQGNNSIPEIVLFGKKVGDTPQDTVIIPAPPTTTGLTGVGARINVCGYHWIPWGKVAGVFTKQRIFQVAEWTWDEKGFSPQPLAGAISETVLGYDDYLADAKAKGVSIIPAINQTPSWFANHPNQPQLLFVSDADGSSLPYYNPKQGIADYLGQGPEVPSMAIDGYDPDMLPRKPGTDPVDPASYIDWAKFFFQWGARYGTKAWPLDMIHVNETPPYPNYPHNEKKTGLGLLEYIEPGNEPIKFWKPELGVTPEQVAAMMSAVYDGHNGTLGRGVGLYDCGIKVVLPGLTSANLDEYKRMEAWCRANRPDKTLAWDIVNFHWYSNTGNIAGVWPPRQWIAGAPADCDPGWSDVEKFVTYVHSTGMPVWCTEFGYDSRGPSWQEAVPYRNYTGEELQAMWLVRNYLMLFRAGVDQAFVFNGINEPGAVNGGLYQNSGLLYGRGEPAPYSPKLAYHAVAALAKSLDGYTYIGDASPGGNVMLMRFKKGNQTICYTWMRTVDGSTAKIKLDGKTITVTETPQVIVMKAGRIIREKKGPINKIIFPKTSPRLKK
jgi:hypothetical protein